MEARVLCIYAWPRHSWAAALRNECHSSLDHDPSHNTFDYLVHSLVECCANIFLANVFTQNLISLG